MSVWQRSVIYILFIILGIAISFLIFLLVGYYQNLELAEYKKREEQKQAILAELKIKNEQAKLAREEERKKLENELDLKAGAFMVYNLDKDKEIFSKNKNKKFGIASLTKIASTIVALENYPQNKIFTINQLNLNELEDNGLIFGEKFTLENLILFTMIVSSNDGASALTNFLGKNIFLEKMNELAEKLNLKSSIFFSESGLDINPQIAGAYSTVADLTELIKYFYQTYPKISAKFSRKEKEICSENDICHKIINTNKLFAEQNYIDIEGEKIEVLFSKTGFTGKSGGSLAMIVEIAGQKILLIVLASSEEERFADMKKLIKQSKKFLLSTGFAVKKM